MRINLFNYLSYDPLLVSLSSHENQVTCLLEKIRSLSQEKVKINGKFGELISFITPKIDIMLSGLEDA